MKKSYLDLTALILRIGFGALMIPHGLKKLDKLNNPISELTFTDPLGMGSKNSLIAAAVVELLFPVLVMLGAKVRITTLPLIATMVIAAFIVHKGDSLSDREPALLFLFGYVAIWLLGAGKYSVKSLR